jgi:hypothetical protein
LPQNAKPLLRKDLSQAGNGTYKPAYKENRKVTPNEAQNPEAASGWDRTGWPEYRSRDLLCSYAMATNEDLADAEPNA